jgi:hypothetical protein
MTYGYGFLDGRKYKYSDLPTVEEHMIESNRKQKAIETQKIAEIYADMKIHSDAWLAQELKSIAKIFGVRV